MARGTPSAISLGPGILWIAPLGTTEPTDLTTAWGTVAAAWVQLGYTDEGSEFSYSIDTDRVEVAEELDPIKIAVNSREIKVSFALAEMTATNLKRGMNGGTITSGSGIVTFEPPDLGSEVRVMIGFESEDHQERWVYRQCFSNGEITVPRKKGSDKTIISCEFELEKPTGVAPFKAIMTAPGRQ
jgi:hypothetical protein